jgi:hypothetical protein
VIADRFLNTAARMLLNTCKPLRAHSLLMQLGRIFPPHRTRQEMQQVARNLRLSGTCLSRSMAIVSRAPTGTVVLAVQLLEGGARLMAHAWVEIGGEPLDPSDPAGGEIARFPGLHGPPVNSGAGQGNRKATRAVRGLSLAPEQCYRPANGEQQHAAQETTGAERAVGEGAARQEAVQEARASAARLGQ